MSHYIMITINIYVCMYTCTHNVNFKQRDMYIIYICIKKISKLSSHIIMYAAFHTLHKSFFRLPRRLLNLSCRQPEQSSMNIISHQGLLLTASKVKGSSRRVSPSRWLCLELLSESWTFLLSKIKEDSHNVIQWKMLIFLIHSAKDLSMSPCYKFINALY
jgi:hypothetical protein